MDGSGTTIVMKSDPPGLTREEERQSVPSGVNVRSGVVLPSRVTQMLPSGVRPMQLNPPDPAKSVGKLPRTFPARSVFDFSHAFVLGDPPRVVAIIIGQVARTKGELRVEQPRPVTTHATEVLAAVGCPQRAVGTLGNAPIRVRRADVPQKRACLGVQPDPGNRLIIDGDNPVTQNHQIAGGIDLGVTGLPL